MAVSASKRHTAVLTAEGEAWTWGHKSITPRRVNLAGVRDIARAAGLAPGSGSGAADATAAAAVQFQRSRGEVVRPAAALLAAGFVHTTVVTRGGSVLTWRSADPALRAQEVLGRLAGGWEV